MLSKGPHISIESETLVPRILRINAQEFAEWPEAVRRLTMELAEELFLVRYNPYIARELVKMGGTPVLREGFVTDNGNLILDVRGLQILDPVDFETRLNQIAGVVTNGLFANRPADVCLIGTPEGVRTMTAD